MLAPPLPYSSQMEVVIGSQNLYFSWANSSMNVKPSTTITYTGLPKLTQAQTFEFWIHISTSLTKNTCPPLCPTGISSSTLAPKTAFTLEFVSVVSGNITSPVNLIKKPRKSSDAFFSHIPTPKRSYQFYVFNISRICFLSCIPTATILVQDLIISRYHQKEPVLSATSHVAF